MYSLRPYLFLLLMIITLPFYVRGQEEIPPNFPGGQQAFSKFILKNLKYPTVAAIIGLTGKVYIKFIVEKNGRITHVVPYKCLGAGCETEAVRVISMSPKWNPEHLYGKSVRVQFTIPIIFSANKPFGQTSFNALRKSNYGFLFYIKDKIYTLNEAQTVLGKSFDPIAIETVEDYDNPKYAMPNKKAVYLIVMKDSL